MRTRRAALRGAIVAVMLYSMAVPPRSSAQAVTQPDEETPAPGLVRIGPVYITPRFRIFSLGVDTNVFYTATDRRTDFIAHGGPGLEVVVPLHGALRLRADGSVGYLYYARTASQRRLTGTSLGRLAYEGLRLSTGAQYTYSETFDRLGFEVNRRVAQTQQQVQADLRYGIGARFALGGRATGTRYDVDDGQQFFGSDLRKNLARDTLGGVVFLSYALTPKTSFVMEADHQTDRFIVDNTRDSDSNRLGGGLVVASKTFLSGRVIAGARSIRFINLDADLLEPFVDADLVYHFGPRTRLGAGYSRDVGFSALSVAAGDLPTLTTEDAHVRLEKGLWRRLDLRLHAALVQLRTDARVLIETPTEGSLSVRRNDRWREAGADLGYAFWTNLRIGLAATYSERRSEVADLGIEGLLLGATITFIPN